MPYLTDYLAAASIAVTLIAFVWMSIIDLKIRILPDELNLAVAISGVLFHLATGWLYISPLMCLGGALAGGGLLLAIRAIANNIYGMDTLGLGDVKLLAAVGLWLGPEHTMLALSAGAFAGLLHGIVYMAYFNIVHKKGLAFRGLTIPAGPGFVVGALIVGIYMFHDLRLFGFGQGEYY